MGQVEIFFRPLLSPLWGEAWAGSLAPWAPTVHSDYLLAGSRSASDPIPSPASSLGPSDPRPGLGLPVTAAQSLPGRSHPSADRRGCLWAWVWPRLSSLAFPARWRPYPAPAPSPARFQQPGDCAVGGRASGQLVAAQLADLVLMGLRTTGFLAGSTASRPERQSPVQIATVCLPGSAQCTLAPLLSRRP